VKNRTSNTTIVWSLLDGTVERPQEIYIRKTYIRHKKYKFYFRLFLVFCTFEYIKRYYYIIYKRNNLSVENLVRKLLNSHTSLLLKLRINIKRIFIFVLNSATCISYQLKVQKRDRKIRFLV